MLYQKFWRSALIIFLGGLLVTPAAGQSTAPESTSEIEQLKRQIGELLRRDAEKQKQIDDLRHTIDKLQAGRAAGESFPTAAAIPAVAAEPASPMGPAAETPAPERPDLWSRKTGAGKLRLIDVSVDTLIAAGSSTATDTELQDLQGGGHDPRKRGFTVQNVELSLMGAVDPHLNGEAHIIFFIDPLTGETNVELEEAFLTTQALPFGLQVKAGQFFTEFGRINPRHPHQWHWLDQPVINTRLFGPDGMRGPGVRLGWLTPLPWYAEFLTGIQNANGETMASFLANDEFFEERPIGGRPFTDRSFRSLEDLVYLARFENSLDLSDSVSASLGFSGLYGPNATGPEADTWIYGADLVVKWRPALNEHGWPFLVWESELMRRDYHAASFLGETADGEILDLPSATLNDWGFYTQLLYGFHRGWAAGLRYEYASGRGESLDGRKNDPFRDNRYRLSPLLAWHPSEFSRLRLQYNYDRARHLADRDAHSVWLGAEFMYGAHPAHKY